MALDDIMKDKYYLADTIVDALSNDLEALNADLKQKFQEDLYFSIDLTLEGVRMKNAMIIHHYYAWLYKHLLAYDIKESIFFTMYNQILTSFKPYLNQEEQAFIEAIEINDVIKQTKEIKSYITNAESRFFLDLLLKKERVKAKDYIIGLIEEGFPLQNVYLDIIQPSLYEIGRLWAMNKIMIADEHMATVITQYVLTFLYPYIFDSKKHGKKLMAAAIGKETHEIGIRMVADFFELNGYQTQYLGADMPLRALVEQAQIFKPDIIALSLTVTLYSRTLEETIKALKNAMPEVKILIGGQGVLAYDDPLSHFMADGFAFSADEAVKVGDSLVK
ncbi:MAG: B12-binding domain-containing protein [Candidatus Izemoplasmataceae bacterium]